MSHLFLLLGLGTGELIIIALVILLFFGAAKLPELMKGLGKGIKSFKQEMNTLDQDTAKTEPKETVKESESKAE